MAALSYFILHPSLIRFKKKMHRLQKHKSEIRKTYMGGKKKKKPTAPLLFALGNVPNSHQTAGVILAGLKTLRLLEELNPDLSKNHLKLQGNPYV